MIEQIYTISCVSILFWLPYSIVMFYASKKQRNDSEASKAIAIGARFKLMREIAYDVAANIHEEVKRHEKLTGEKLSPDVQNKMSVEKMKKLDSSIAEDEAIFAIKSVLGKIKGAGASGESKI